jgi:hypothetical protein
LKVETNVGSAAVALLLSISSAALATSATPEEVARLVGVFQSYLGKEPCVVNVMPTGEALDVKLDFMPLVSKLQKPDLSTETTPLAFKLVDQGCGKWLVTQDQAISFKVSLPGTLDLTASIGMLKGTGIFAESLTTFSSSSTNMSNIAIDETVNVPSAGTWHVAYGLKSEHRETMAQGPRARAPRVPFSMQPCRALWKPSASQHHP